METVGPFGENTYFLVDEESSEAVIIDPGDEGKRLLAIVEERRLTVRYILNTHGHVDHLAAAAFLRSATGAPFYIHRRESFLLESLPAQAAFFGVDAPEIPHVDGHLLKDQVLCFGRKPIAITVLETPGHTPGGVTFHVEDSLFVGDLIFQGSVGRTDFPGGDHDTLIESIRTQILAFPDATRIYSGHGPVTTVGEERLTNPFLI